MQNSRWFYIYLFIISKLRGSSEELNAKIRELTSTEILASAGSIILKRKALVIIEKLRSQIPLSEIDFDFVHMIKTESRKDFAKLTILKSSHLFNNVLDDDFLKGLCSDESKVYQALNSGLEVVRLISKKWKERMDEALEVVAGVEDEYNLINSGFTKDFPGFINININCDPIVIAEQLVHETTHLIFDNKMQFENQVRNFIKSIPPVFSVFANKPRSAELVLHGLFSYTSVYVFWCKIALHDKSNAIRAKVRIREVKNHIDRCIVDLDNVLSRKDWASIYLIYKDICPLADKDIWKKHSTAFKSIKRLIPTLQKYLNDIEIAELILAIEGNKVSRISLDVKIVKELIPFLNKLPVFYCFSNYIFTSSVDERLVNFQNVISSIYDLDSHMNEELDIHIYLANTKIKLKKAFLLDKDNKCASLFKTPSCCETHFLKNWDNCVTNYSGDMTKLYITNSTNSIEGNVLYNPIGMYFGLGFCWHFPCSLSCKKTKKVVDERIRILKRFKVIYNTLNEIAQYQILYDSKLGYSLIR